MREAVEPGSAWAGHLDTWGTRSLHEVPPDGSDFVTDDLLSPREGEVAALIARGLTNSEIAQRLIISRRTVESHVEHIKSKLGFARRARIVVWALERKGYTHPPSRQIP